MESVTLDLKGLSSHELLDLDALLRDQVEQTSDTLVDLGRRRMKSTPEYRQCLKSLNRTIVLWSKVDDLIPGKDG